MYVLASWFDWVTFMILGLRGGLERSERRARPLRFSLCVVYGSERATSEASGERDPLGQTERLLRPFAFGHSPACVAASSGLRVPVCSLDLAICRATRGKSQEPNGKPEL